MFFHIMVEHNPNNRKKKNLIFLLCISWWIGIYLNENINVTLYWKMQIYSQIFLMIFNFYETHSIYFTCDST